MKQHLPKKVRKIVNESVVEEGRFPGFWHGDVVEFQTGLGKYELTMPCSMTRGTRKVEVVVRGGSVRVEHNAEDWT